MRCRASAPSLTHKNEPREASACLTELDPAHESPGMSSELFRVYESSTVNTHAVDLPSSVPTCQIMRGLTSVFNSNSASVTCRRGCLTGTTGAQQPHAAHKRHALCASHNRHGVPQPPTQQNPCTSQGAWHLTRVTAPGNAMMTHPPPLRYARSWHAGTPRAFTAHTTARRRVQVLPFSGGEEALHHLATCMVLPDLVLLDCMMPSMDGFEVLRRLRAMSQSMHLPVIMVSARVGGTRPRQRVGAHGLASMLGPACFAAGEKLRAFARMRVCVCVCACMRVCACLHVCACACVCVHV